MNGDWQIGVAKYGLWGRKFPATRVQKNALHQIWHFLCYIDIVILSGDIAKIALLQNVLGLQNRAKRANYMAPYTTECTKNTTALMKIELIAKLIRKQGRLPKWYTSVITPLLCLAWLLPWHSAVAQVRDLQEHQGTPQTVIESIEAVEERNGIVDVLINGSPIQDLTEHKIEYEQGTNDVIILKLHHTIVDKGALPEELLNFSENALLKSVELNPRYQEEEQTFNVELRFLAHKPIRAAISKIDNQQMKIAFQSIEDVLPQEPNIPDELRTAENTSPEYDDKKARFNADGSIFFSDDFNLYKPTSINVTIVSTAKNFNAATKLSIFLADTQRTYFYEKLGAQLNVLQITKDDNITYAKTTLYFRANFLKPSMIVAKAIAGNQVVKRMLSPNKKNGVDIEIYVGNDL